MAAQPPPKPWERQGGAGGSSTVSPLGTASTGGASHWDTPQAAQNDSVAALNESAALATAQPARPWLSGAGPAFAQPSGSAYGMSNFSGTGMYGGTGYGMGGSMFGRPGGMYGGSTYGTGYGGGHSGYGGYGSGGMYGGGSYGGGMFGGMGGGYGGMGGGMYGGGMAPYGQQGAPGAEGPPRPPGGWETVLRGLHGVMGVFGRITMLVDENTYAVNFFIQALLQLLDRFGSLYGELARWVLRLLGWGREKQKAAALEHGAAQCGQQVPQQQGQRPAAPPVGGFLPLPQPETGVPGPTEGGGIGGRGFDAAWSGSGSGGS